MTRMTVAELGALVEDQGAQLAKQVETNEALTKSVADLVEQVSTLTTALLSNAEAKPTKAKGKPKVSPNPKTKSSQLPKGASRKIKAAFGKAIETGGSVFKADGVSFAVYAEKDWTWVASYPKPDDEVIEKLRSETGAKWSSRREAHYIQSALTAKQLQDILSL